MLIFHPNPLVSTLFWPSTIHFKALWLLVQVQEGFPCRRAEDVLVPVQVVVYNVLFAELAEMVQGQRGLAQAKH